MTEESDRSRPEITLRKTPHRVSVGFCRAGSHAGCYVACVTHVSPHSPPWYLLEFNGPTCEWGPDEHDDYTFDSKAELEEMIETLDIEWFPEDEVEGKMLENFPASREPKKIDALVEWFWNLGAQRGDSRF